MSDREPQKVKGREGWYANFRLDGQRFRYRLAATSKVAARQELKEDHARLILKAKEEAKQNFTMNDAAVAYWEGKAQYDASGAGVIRPTLMRFMDQLGSDKMLSEIEPVDIGRYVISARKKFANDTVNTHLKVFRAFLNWSRKNLKASVPDITWGDYFLAYRETDNSLPLEEIEAIADHAAPHLRPIILTALYTGFRRSNVLNLRWEEINLQDRVITLRVKSAKPGGKIHTKPIIEPLFLLLVGIDPRKSGHVFLYKGQPVKNVKRAFDTAKRRAGITGPFRFHDIRHSVGTAAQYSTSDIEGVRLLLGHEDLATTKRYIHAGVDYQRRILERTFASSHPVPSKRTTKRTIKEKGPAENVS